MRAAIRISLAKMRGNHGGPFGAVVVRRGKIVGRGWNQVTSTNDPTAHAEVSAIRDACGRLKTFRLDDCELYSSCEPCPLCLAAIYWARCRRVYYGNTRQDAARIDFDDDFIYRSIGVRRVESQVRQGLLLSNRLAERHVFAAASLFCLQLAAGIGGKSQTNR